MPEIWISSTHTIVGPPRTEPNDGPFVFHYRNDHLADCEVTVNASGESIMSKARVMVSEGLFEALGNDTLISELPEELGIEMEQKRRLLTMVSRSVLRLLQQEIQDFELLPANELSALPEGNQWSLDGETWREIQGFRTKVAVSDHRIGKLDERWKQIIQKLLDEGEEPLLAMQHLYEAERSEGLRFKWIEATIAAELAIKEVLVRIEPKLKTLLIEVPSPPLGKLYGEVLKSVAGEESPFRKELQKGAERRNRLIHRAEDEKLDHQQVINYLDTVAHAIRHLLDLHRRMHVRSTNG